MVINDYNILFSKFSLQIFDVQIIIIFYNIFFYPRLLILINKIFFKKILTLKIKIIDFTL
jgi:hypothetical protein